MVHTNNGIHFWLLFLTQALCCWGGNPSLIAAEPAKMAQDWDALFTRTEGWTGGDVAGSIELGDGRILWLFGDSWIGAVEQGRHKPGSRLVNNSLAIQTIKDRNDAQQPPTVQFHWGKNNADGHPTAWVVPNPQQFPAMKSADGKPIEHWFWTTGGGTVEPLANDRSRLLISLFHIARTAGQEGVWNFQSQGGAIAVIENYQEPIEKWVVEQHPLPHAISGDQARHDKTQAEISWGQVMLVRHPHVYIYGVRETAPLKKHVMLARAPLEKIEQPESWEFFAGDKKWSPQLSNAQPVADRAVNEFSMEEIKQDNGSYFILVQSEPNLGKQIWVRTAQQPEGPWSEPVVIHTVKDVELHPTYFTYAAKGHAHLSQPGELLVTYLINAHDFSAMFNDAEIYRPRFLRVPLRDCLPH